MEFRDLARCEVELVVEFQGVQILYLVPDHAEFWVPIIEGVDQFCISAIRATEGRMLYVRLYLRGWEQVRIDIRGHLAGLCHQFRRLVAGEAGSTAHLRHETASLMLDMAAVAGEFSGHVRLVEILSRVAGQAVLVHAGGWGGAFIDQSVRSQAAGERLADLGRPCVCIAAGAFVTGGATAVIGGDFFGQIREMLAGVCAGDRAGIDEFVPRFAVDTDEEDQYAGDDGERDDALADGAQCAAGLAFRDGLAAGAVGEGPVRAFSAGGCGAGALPIS